MSSYFETWQNGGNYPNNQTYSMYCNAFALHKKNMPMIYYMSIIPFKAVIFTVSRKVKKNEYIIRINYQTDWNFWEGMIVMFCVYSLEKSKWVLLCCINLLKYW